MNTITNICIALIFAKTLVGRGVIAKVVHHFGFDCVFKKQVFQKFAWCVPCHPPYPLPYSSVNRSFGLLLRLSALSRKQESRNRRSLKLRNCQFRSKSRRAKTYTSNLYFLQRFRVKKKRIFNKFSTQSQATIFCNNLCE